MKIDFWAPSMTTFGGGIASFSRELASALLEQGNALRFYGKLEERQDWNGHLIRSSGIFRGRLRTPAFATRAVAGCMLTNPDLVVSTHLNFGPLAHLSRRITGTPYALVAHGVDVSPSLSQARIHALRTADKLVAVSNWTRQRLLEIDGIRDFRIAILPNTYDENRFTVGNRPISLRSRYHLRDDEKVVLTVARLDAAEGYKGYDRILQAMPAVIRNHGPVRFIIGGKGGDRIRLETMARELGVEDSVTFAGFIPDEELADHYRLADVFAMPSTGEGFGIVFLEAMACGTPVMGGNMDGSVDALANGALGLLVNPTSIEAITRGLIQLLGEEGPAQWFSRNHLSEMVQVKFGRSSFRKKVETIFSHSQIPDQRLN